MALTLECSCSADVSICNLTQLVWNVLVIIDKEGPVDALGQITLQGSGGSQKNIFLSSPLDAGLYAFDLVPLADWISPTATILVSASTWQVTPGHYKISGADSIDQHYECVNVVTGRVDRRVISSYASDNDGEHKCETGDEDIRSVCQNIGGTLFKSTPLGACNGCQSSQSGYSPAPDLGVTIDVNNSGSVCLCATGGSGNYSFSIVSGTLPCGQRLNPSTGCIEGTPDGTCDGSSSVTYRVTDAGVTGSPSGGVTIGGTCRVFGGGATRITGGAWTADMVGNSILLGATSYAVTGVDVPSQSITINPANGIVDPQSWSYTSPIIPAPPPGPPETAEVTCGYILGCPTGDDGLGGNQAF